MGEVYRNYHVKGLEVLFAAVNLSPNVPEFINRFNVPFRVGTADDAKARLFFEFTMTMPSYVPWLMFIDKTSVIRAQFTGSDSIFNQGVDGITRVIDPLLVEKVQATPPKAATKGTTKK